MTFASRTQFHVERPWGQRPLSIVSSRGLIRDYEPSDAIRMQLFEALLGSVPHSRHICNGNNLHTKTAKLLPQYISPDIRYRKRNESFIMAFLTVLIALLPCTECWVVNVNKGRTGERAQTTRATCPDNRVGTGEVLLSTYHQPGGRKLTLARVKN